jgi:hypothetical protein
MKSGERSVKVATIMYNVRNNINPETGMFKLKSSFGTDF